MRLFDFKKTKKNNPFTSFEKVYVDDNHKIWQAVYTYDTVEIEAIWKICKYLKVNQPVNFSFATPNEPISVLVDGKTIGYLKNQKNMLSDYIQKKEALVRAQISSLSRKMVALQIYYYRSQDLLDKQKADYEAEKAAHIRKPAITQEVKLVANKSEDMQHEISCAIIGSELDIWEEDEDRYVVSVKETIYDIGYLPKQIVAKINDFEEDGYTCRGILLDTPLNDSGKKDVIIKLILEDATFL